MSTIYQQSMDVLDQEAEKLTSPEEISLNTNEGTSGSGRFIWRLVNLMMTIFFLLASGVQFNDPDPYLWVPLYGTAACLTCSVAVQPTLTKSKIWKVIHSIHFCYCLGIFLYVLVELFITVASSKDGALNPLTYEEGRELFGVMITALWLFVVKQSPTVKSAEGVNKLGSGVKMTFLVLFSLLPLFLWGLCFFLNDSYFALCSDFWITAGAREFHHQL